MAQRTAVKYLEPAKAELEDGVIHYQSIHPDLALLFLQEVRSAIRRITRYPESYVLLTPPVRRCPLRKFPYSVLYKIGNNDIIIIAVMHMKRKPEYWETRLKPHAD